MFIEFIDQLRCTQAHEESWLVASFAERDSRFIIRGTLGCHICLREYPIVGGVAYFGCSPDDRRLDRESSERSEPSDPEAAMKAAAFLNASERATLVLAGSWALHAHEVVAVMPLRICALNPSAFMSDAEQVAIVESSEGVPLARASVAGVALDENTATPANLTSALRTLKAGGRLVAPANTPVPGEITVLAQDATYWVGEKRGEFVPLQRA